MILQDTLKMNEDFNDCNKFTFAPLKFKRKFCAGSLLKWI